MPHKKHTRKEKRPQEKRNWVKLLIPWIELAAKTAVLINALAELIHKI